MLSHKYDKKTVSATCVSEGYTEYQCRNCYYFYIGDYVPKKNHNIDSNGKCTYCKESFSISISSRFGNIALSWNEKSKISISGPIITIETSFQGTVLTTSDVKYITIQLAYYNAVNDVLYTSSFRSTGPFKYGDTLSSNMKVGDDSFGFWMAVSKKGEKITDVKIAGITIEYADGRKEVCSN